MLRLYETPPRQILDITKQQFSTYFNAHDVVTRKRLNENNIVESILQLCLDLCDKYSVKWEFPKRLTFPNSHDGGDSDHNEQEPATKKRQ